MLGRAVLTSPKRLARLQEVELLRVWPAQLLCSEKDSSRTLESVNLWKLTKLAKSVASMTKLTNGLPLTSTLFSSHSKKTKTRKLWLKTDKSRCEKSWKDSRMNSENAKNCSSLTHRSTQKSLMHAISFKTKSTKTVGKKKCARFKRSKGGALSTQSWEKNSTRSKGKLSLKVSRKWWMTSA